MTPYVPTIAIDDTIDALADFIQLFAGSAEIIRAQVNLVPPPHDPYVLLTELHSVPLETPSVYDNPLTEQANITSPSRIDIQVDFYGPFSGEQCKAVQMVYRSSRAYSLFPSNVKPLYCSDGIQSPLITAEQQYESRWTLTASLQYNPTVSIPQQSATELAVEILENI